MEEKVEGLVEQVQNMGKKEMIDRLLEFHSLEETAEFLQMDEREILYIINSRLTFLIYFLKYLLFALNSF